MRAWPLLVVACGSLLASASALAEPIVGHTPLATAEPGQPIDIVIEVDKPGEVRRARLRYRTEGANTFDKADFTTTGPTRTATIPGDAVRAPAVEYFIIVQRADGAVEPVHGSPRDPIRVKVPKKEEPAETKPAEAKVDEKKPAETKPADSKPTDEKKPLEKVDEKKPADAKVDEKKPTETKPTDTKVDEKKPAETKPTETKVEEKKPAETKPTETKADEKKPAETKPADAKVDEKKPADTKPADAKVDEKKPADAKSANEKKPEDAASTSAPPAASGETPPSTSGDASVDAKSDAKADAKDPTQPAGERETAARVKPRRLRGAGLTEASKDPLADDAALFAARAPEGFRARPIVAETFVTTHALTRGDIERLPVRNLADIVRLLPGVEMTRTLLGYDVVTIRGQRGDARAQVVVDGMRFANPYDGRVPWFLPVALIDSVTVSLGPAVDGDGPRIGGAVIDVKTRALDGIAAEAWGNTFTGGGAAVVGGVDLGVVHMWGGANVQGEVGPVISIDEDRYTNSAFERPPEEMLTVAQNLRGAMTAGVEAPIGPVVVDARLVSAGEWRGPYVGWFDTLGEDSTLTWVDTRASAGVRASFASFLTLGARLFVGHDYVDQSLQLTPKEFTAPAADGTVATFDDGVQVRRAYSIFDVGGEASALVQAFTGNALSVGTSLDLATIPPGGYYLEANRAANGTAQTLGVVDGVPLPQSGPCPFFGSDIPLGACRLTMAFAVRDEQDLFGVVKIGAGVRVVGFSDVGFDPATHVLPHLGVRVRLTEMFTLRASLMTGVRAPTFEEQYDQTGLVVADLSRGVVVGNPALRTEAFRTVDAGVESTLGIGTTRTRLSLSAFASGTDDAIEALPLNGNLEVPSNAGGAARDLQGPVIVGVEGSGVVDVFGGTRLFANASWFRSTWRARLDLDEEEPVCAAVPGYLLPIDDPAAPPCGYVTELPQFRANVGAIADVDVLGSFSAVATLGSERRNNARTTLEGLRAYRIPAYGLMSLGFRSHPIFGLGVWAQVQNLLDASVKDDTARPDRVTGLVPREQTAVWAGLYVDLQ